MHNRTLRSQCIIQELYNTLGGATQKVIADKLGINEKTVRRYWKSVIKL